jgi:ribosomal protein S18 acetylase RimI-like enzyme
MALTVRKMTEADLTAAGKMGADLIRLHHAWDDKRFFTVDNPDSGYRWFLGTQLKNPETVLLVADIDGTVAGYLYGSIEERDWQLLLDAHGAVNDVFVDERFRKQGTGAALMKAGIEALEKLGAKRIVLSSATPNTQAQKLFESLGFRRTMVEMTRG